MAKKSITKNYLYNMFYQVLTLVLPLITTPYLSRVLGANGIGIYGYTYAIVTYFILFGSLGIALYGQREIAYAQENVEKRKKIFIEIIIFRFITISIASIFYFIFFMRKSEYSVFYRILFLEIIAAGFDISWFFQGLEEFKRTVIRNVLVRVCSVSLVFIFVKDKDDLALFTLIYSLADLLGNLSLWLYLPKYLRGVKVKNLNIQRHIPQILLLFIPQIANQLYKILDTTMIGVLVKDKTETGFYDQGQKVIRLLLTIVTSRGVVMIPRIANTFASGDKEKIKSYMKMSFKFVFFLAFPIMFGIIVVADNFVPIFFGKGYDKVIILMRIISPIVLLMGIGNVVGTQYLVPSKRQKEYTISIMIGVVVNFILNYILIIKFKSIGASIATVLSELIVITVQLYFIKNDFNIKEFLDISVKYMISAIIMFFACNLVKVLFSLFYVAQEFKYNLVILVLEVAIGFITYIISLIIMKDDAIKFVMDKIQNFLHRKVEKNVQ